MECEPQENGEDLTAIGADWYIKSSDVIESLTELMVPKGVPDHIRSDNGLEFTVGAIQEWPRKMGAKTLYIGTSESGSP